MKFTKKTNLSYQHYESVVILILTISAFVIPFFTRTSNNSAISVDIISDWTQIAAYLLLFLLNIYFFIPKLLRRKQYLRYILVIAVTIPFILCISTRIIDVQKMNSPSGMPPMTLGPGQAPMEFTGEIPPPAKFMKKPPKKNTAGIKFLQHVGIAFLVMGTGTAYKVLLFWMREEKERKLLEESLKSQDLNKEEYLFVKSDYKIVKIKISEITYIESANEYIQIMLDSGEMVTTFMRLKNMESTLPPNQFMRVQRSFIVNLEKIKAVEKNRIFIEHKKFIPIGEQYKESFQDFLGKNFVK